MIFPSKRSSGQIKKNKKNNKTIYLLKQKTTWDMAIRKENKSKVFLDVQTKINMGLLKPQKYSRGFAQPMRVNQLNN